MLQEEEEERRQKRKNVREMGERQSREEVGRLEECPHIRALLWAFKGVLCFLFTATMKILGRFGMCFGRKVASLYVWVLKGC